MTCVDFTYAYTFHNFKLWYNIKLNECELETYYRVLTYKSNKTNANNIRN